MTAPAPPAPRWGRFLRSTVFLRNPQYLWKTIGWLLPEEGFHYAQIYRPLGSPRGDPFRFLAATRRSKTGGEEEMADISLATFYVFDKEKVGYWPVSGTSGLL